jgi:hypothetical protein
MHTVVSDLFIPRVDTSVDTHEEANERKRERVVVVVLVVVVASPVLRTSGVSCEL